jgi:hypothetical protein
VEVLENKQTVAEQKLAAFARLLDVEVDIVKGLENKQIVGGDKLVVFARSPDEAAEAVDGDTLVACVAGVDVVKTSIPSCQGAKM